MFYVNWKINESKPSCKILHVNIRIIWTVRKLPYTQLATLFQQNRENISLPRQRFCCCLFGAVNWRQRHSPTPWDAMITQFHLGDLFSVGQLQVPLTNSRVCLCQLQ